MVTVGKSVSHLQQGDRVGWCSVLGTYAEYAVAPSERVVPIPIGVTFEQAATALLQGMTAHYLSHSAYPIQPGDEVLIHAGAGGTGLLLTQLAKSRGARVLTTVSNGEKAETSEPFETTLRYLTGTPSMSLRQWIQENRFSLVG